MAAGGGGDAVGALLARRALGDADERPPLVTTCAWERLRIDPVPGPRARADFTRLGLVGGEPCEVLPTSDTTPSGRSVLPRLAETSGARIFLHDFEGGAAGLAGQLVRLAASLDVNKLVVQDVGGDIVARGPEPELRSPLADSLTLAAALETGIPAAVVVVGAGVDAELFEGDVRGLLDRAGAWPVGHVTEHDVRRLEQVLSWHPTEASALAAASATGMVGLVATRRGSTLVPLSERTREVWVAREPTFGQFPLAQALRITTNLSEAEDVMRTDATNEIDFERTVARGAGRRQPRVALPQLVAELTSAGATHLTSRRLSDTIGDRRVAEGAARVGHAAGGLWSLDEIVRAFPSE